MKLCMMVELLKLWDMYGDDLEVVVDTGDPEYIFDIKDVSMQNNDLVVISIDKATGMVEDIVDDVNKRSGVVGERHNHASDDSMHDGVQPDTGLVKKGSRNKQQDYVR